MPPAPTSPDHPDHAVVLAEDVSVTVAGSTLLAPISLRATPGDIIALRGANGSGKTTALRVLAGELPPSTGRVEVLGTTPAERDPAFRAGVAGLVGGNLALAANLTLLEHLELVLISWGAPPAHAAQWLTRMELSALADRFPHELSSGQRQIYALTLALARPSRVLLLDEPEQRLDTDRVALVAARLRAMAETGGCTVMATHSQELVDATGATVVHLTDATRTPDASE